jgi:(p)ppGpp synthase/HD superfamily hydrolase
MLSPPPQPLLTTRFAEAFALANQLHAHQYRKQTTIPYISHLMSVSALVLEMGGNEDEAIAALLHDAVEDQGGLATLTQIKDRFGEIVAGLVRHCSDCVVSPKPPWQERKDRHLAKLQIAPLSTLRVSLADTLHNARSIQIERRLAGESIWHKFSQGKDGIVWYYGSLSQLYHERLNSAWSQELAEIIRDWQQS